MDKIFENCILASDVDGTLMEQGYINPRNFAAINEFIEKGGTFCIATGRSPAAMKHIVSQFENMQYVIYYNGGMIYDNINKKILVNKVLSDDDKHFFIDVAEKIPELGIEVYSGDDVYIVRDSEACRAQFTYEHLPIRYTDFDTALPMKWNKALSFYTIDYDETAFKALIDGFEKQSSEFAMAAGFIDGVHYRGYEQLPKGANKGQGLLELADILGTAKGNVFAIGDYYNDYEMLKVADISACPKESSEDIKQLVDFVGCACRDGAVADFIEYLKTANR